MSATTLHEGAYSVLDNSTEFSCVRHAGDYGGYLEIAEESFLRQIRNITRTQVEPG